jgi:predicted nucleotidyltransferase
MQKSSWAYLKSESKKLLTKDIFDIVLYGSSVKSKEYPEDTDIAIIFFNKKLNERLEISQKFKDKIKNKIPDPDVKGINLSDFMDASFFARQGIIIEGQSLLTNSPLSEKFGFEGYILFTYSLKNLNHNEKTKFTYSLIGRTGRGMIEISEARPLGKGAFIVPIKKSVLFEDFLKEWKINFKSKKILVSK